MIQIALGAVAVGLLYLGYKGFTDGGIPISKTIVLRGTSGKIAGVLCIVAGVIFIPAFLVAIGLFSKFISN